MDALSRFLALALAGQAPLASPDKINANSRRARTGVLAALLDTIALESPVEQADAARPTPTEQ